MNPNSNEAPIQLPPVAEQAPSEVPAAAGGQVEQAPSAPETAPNPAAKAPAVAQPSAAIPLPTMPIIEQNVSQPAVSATTQNGGVSVDDDGDLIEKEWVNKAKAIVERNRDDPYKQSEELTVFKADYMKKHYNKTIKLNK